MLSQQILIDLIDQSVTLRRDRDERNQELPELSVWGKQESLNYHAPLNWRLYNSRLKAKTRSLKRLLESSQDSVKKR